MHQVAVPYAVTLLHEFATALCASQLVVAHLKLQLALCNKGLRVHDVVTLLPCMS
jgi:hypothetical protein